MPFPCEICDMVISKKYNLARHYRNVHEVIVSNETSYDFQAHKNKCLDGCNCSFPYLKDLRDHLKQVHNFETVQETLTFKNFEDFSEWLNNINRDSSQYLLTNHAENKLEGYTTFYYYCNRSGVHISKSKGKRRLKKQGSCKLQRSCTSSIIVKKKRKSGKCIVTFYKTHYKHNTELEHLRFPKQDRINIAQKLSNGVPVKRVLEDQRNNTSIPSRRDLLTRKDVHNIIHSFKIKDVINGVQIPFDHEEFVVDEEEITNNLISEDSSESQDTKSSRIVKIREMLNTISEFLPNTNEDKMEYVQETLTDLYNFICKDSEESSKLDMQNSKQKPKIYFSDKFNDHNYTNKLIE